MVTGLGAVRPLGSASSNTNYFSKFLGVLAPALIPPIHIAVLAYFWDSFTHPVDKKHCKNECWDTIFKGPYENGVSSYKHMYFNATSNTLKIWVLTIFCIIAFYESTRYLITLVFQRRIRLTMMVLFVASIFSNYYSWWMYVNYWNDEYYVQWNHQLFFAITEIVSSLLMLNLSDDSNEVTTRKVFGICGIALLHILTGSYDQFVRNVLLGEGESHQVVRDFGFMTADLMNFVIPLVVLVRARKCNWSNVEVRMELYLAGLFVGALFVLYSLL